MSPRLPPTNVNLTQREKHREFFILFEPLIVRERKKRDYITHISISIHKNAPTMNIDEMFKVCLIYIYL